MLQLLLLLWTRTWLLIQQMIEMGVANRLLNRQHRWMDRSGWINILITRDGHLEDVFVNRRVIWCPRVIVADNLIEARLY
jgi:hypothetical protein